MFVFHSFIFLFLFFVQINGEEKTTNDLLAKVQNKYPNCDPKLFFKSSVGFQAFNKDLTKVCSPTKRTEEAKILCSIIYYQLKLTCAIETKHRPAPVVYMKKYEPKDICSIANISLTNRWIWSKLRSVKENSIEMTIDNLCEKLASQEELLRLLRFFYIMAPSVQTITSANQVQQAKSNETPIETAQSNKGTQQTDLGKNKEGEQTNSTVIELTNATKPTEKTNITIETKKVSNETNLTETNHSSINETNIGKSSNTTIQNKTLDLNQNQTENILREKTTNQSITISSSSTASSSTVATTKKIKVDSDLNTKKQETDAKNAKNEGNEEENDGDDEGEGEEKKPEQDKSVKPKEENPPSVGQIPKPDANNQQETKGNATKVEETIEQKKSTEASTIKNSSKLINETIEISESKPKDEVEETEKDGKEVNQSVDKNNQEGPDDYPDDENDKKNVQRPPGNDDDDDDGQEAVQPPLVDDKKDHEKAVNEDEAIINEALKNADEQGEENFDEEEIQEDQDENLPEDPDQIDDNFNDDQIEQEKPIHRKPGNNGKDQEQTIRKEDLEPVNIPQKNRRPKYPEDEGWSGSFITYFLLFTLFVVVGYLILHNKNKLMGYLIEGRRSKTSRTGTRPSHRHYEQIKNVNDVIDIDQTESRLNKDSIILKN